MIWLLQTVALALLAVAVGTPAAAQSSVPRLDVGATCRPIDKKDSSQINTESCLKSEREAREKVAQDWSRFPAADRELCTQTARLGGFESYVQLLTCLELRRDVAAAPTQREPSIEAGGETARRQLRNRPARLPGQ
jgi:hypothetical protein